MASLWNNDEARQFFEDHGYPHQYNQGLLAWLRDFYNVDYGTLGDLLDRYIEEHGILMLETGTNGFLQKEDLYYLLLQNGSRIILEQGLIPDNG